MNMDRNTVSRSYGSGSAEPLSHSWKAGVCSRLGLTHGPRPRRQQWDCQRRRLLIAHSSRFGPRPKRKRRHDRPVGASGPCHRWLYPLIGSSRPAVADVCGQRRMQDLDGLKPERLDAVEDPLAGAEQDRRDVERELVDEIDMWQVVSGIGVLSG